MGREWDTFDKKMFGKEGEEGKNDLKVKKNFKILPRYANADLYGFQNFIYQAFTEAIRVLKPGGYALVWAIPRTSHHTAMGLERAGFEIRDCLYYIFGSGFPKSLNIGKAVDKLQGNKREVVGKNKNYRPVSGKKGYLGESNFRQGESNFRQTDGMSISTKGNSPYEGWGTALKPAVECWWLCRKPLSEKTVAQNVLKWGVGGLNIDGGRIETDEMLGRKEGTPTENVYDLGINKNKKNRFIDNSTSIGRFPANIILDEEAGKMLDKQSGKSKSINTKRNRNTLGSFGMPNDLTPEYSDKGGASRFFYCAKPSKTERNRMMEGFGEKKSDLNSGGIGRKCSVKKRLKDDGVNAPMMKNNHPTVKSISLMSYLCRLITPPKGIVLDPFAGSGSTLIAAKKEGFNFIGIEKDPEYVKIAEARIKNVQPKLL